jgi:general stress protein YciG
MSMNKMESKPKMSKAEAGRLGGEASAGSEKHYTKESKARQIAGARKGGEHSHGSRSMSSGSQEKMSMEEEEKKNYEENW